MAVIGSRPDPEALAAQLSGLPRPWIADIGSGGDPWPDANILVDKYPGLTVHRRTNLQTDGKLFVQGDICALPFRDHSLDFVIASHVIEHLDDPLVGLAELQRVSSKGVAWVPSVMGEVAARVVYPRNISGHRWVGLHERGHGFMFVRYEETNPTQWNAVLKALTGSRRYIVTGYGTEMRIAWGWGSWPHRVFARRVRLDEIVEGNERETETE